ncbi:proline racemase family protein [Evansella sp. LMS18]|uniref:proline racemase family protein n=1 Tax=Evansella sp. LMS18 TaxID=2924033 RepID=UPI0020D132B2|nr:proline racemase family protein [Evansella sp. LMS18]UTR12001.1 proline racemase family protein [Evansella sp. LMS18]
MEITNMYSTIDAHTAGEPLRIITGGLPEIKGETILQKRAYFREFHDNIRRFLMHEPRGHEGMYGCVMTPPVSDEADFGVLFMHNEGFSTMCGHGIIAVVTAAVETGMVSKKGDRQSQFIIDTPAGQVIATAEHEGSVVKNVSFENVPSFVYKSDYEVSLPEGSFKVDIAFGGAFYAVVHAEDIGVNVLVDELPALKTWGKKIKEFIDGNLEVIHPLERELKGIYGVIISDRPKKADSHLRNVTVFAEGQIDRSPCGTGTSARLATLYARGELKAGESFIHESIIESQLEGEITALTRVENYDAVIPTIKGKASITGFHKFVKTPADEIGDGFLL